MSIIKSPNAVQEGFRLKKYNINGIVLLLIGFYLILPLAVTLIYSLSTEWMEVLPRGFTAKYYAELVSDYLLYSGGADSSGSAFGHVCGDGLPAGV